MPHKERKVRKQRGSRYMGWGQVGQHRKSGGRGGKGKAGGRKHFWIQTVKYTPTRYKKKGFLPPSVKRPTPETINVGELEEKFPGKKNIDLTKEGFDRLLGKGTPRDGLNISVRHASAGAIEKVKAKGGAVKIVE